MFLRLLLLLLLRIRPRRFLLHRIACVMSTASGSGAALGTILFAVAHPGHDVFG